MRAFALLLFYLAVAYALLNLASCDDMDDIQKQFADVEEQIYLGKVDSVEVIPGFGRAKLKWEMSADPRIDRVKIYWNNKRDSTTKEFNRPAAGSIEDSLIVENLAEGNYTFELKSENEMGESSLATFVSGEVWGPVRGNDLGSRSITSFAYDHETSSYTLDLSPVAITNLEVAMVFSEIGYQSTDGSSQTTRVRFDSTQIVLPDFAAGSEFTIRDAFVSENVIDTIYNTERTIGSQAVSEVSPVGLGIPGNPESGFFTVGDSLLWEWRTGGEVVVYTYENNVVLPVRTIPASVFSRDSFNVLFNYDMDKLITVSHDGEVTMHQIHADSISTILTPGGAVAMGTGFTSFSKYVPAAGFFYTVTTGTGDLRSWLAQSDATWGSPNGSTLATGFDKYKVLTTYNNGLLGIDEDGALWQIATNITGSPIQYTKVGSNWDRFVALIPLGSAILALDQSGEFYLFDAFPGTLGYLVLN